MLRKKLRRFKLSSGIKMSHCPRNCLETFSRIFLPRLLPRLASSTEPGWLVMARIILLVQCSETYCQILKIIKWITEVIFSTTIFNLTESRAHKV